MSTPLQEFTPDKSSYERAYSDVGLRTSVGWLPVSHWSE